MNFESGLKLALQISFGVILGFCVPAVVLLLAMVLDADYLYTFSLFVLSPAAAVASCVSLGYQKRWSILTGAIIGAIIFFILLWIGFSHADF